MTDKVNELLVKWAEKKWPEYSGKIDRVMVESTSWTEGYCETCSYTVTGVDITLYKDNSRVAYFDEMQYDLATMLNEVLE
jgi:hypothetical protein